MPRFDRTGPRGQGSQTGQKLGECNNSSTKESEDTSPGRRMGKGRGAGKQCGMGKGNAQRKGNGMGKSSV